MNILFDCITPQHFVGGAGEYTRKVFYSLLERIRSEKMSVNVFGCIDSGLKKYAYSDLSPEGLKEFGVIPIDINGKSLNVIVNQNKIDKVFIAAGQFWTKYNMTGVTCPLICVIHDLCDEEYCENRLIDFEKSIELTSYIFFRLRRLIRKPRRLSANKSLIENIKRNEKSRLITVSEYSRRCIHYHYDIKDEKLSVLYSPERITIVEPSIQDMVLRDVIETKKKYYLLLSANRKKKNAQSAIRAFQRHIANSGDDAWLVTVGAKHAQFDRQIVLPYLCESDLSHALSNCYALVFPSIFEGFGYPPVEAMKYGKPVLHSNVTSIPEIVGGGQISFSPFYSSDIYSAFMTLNDSNYKAYSDNARIRHQELSKRQNKDLQKLLDLILE